jgi:replicative superfamily II helicase
MIIIKIILDFLKILLSWPAILFWVSLIIFFKYGKSIKTFIENIIEVKYGDFVAKLQQGAREDGYLKDEDPKMKEQIENLLKEKDESKGEIEKSKQIINYLDKRAKAFEFAYLSLWLHPNSKRALEWFSLEHTKKEFIEQFKIIPVKVFQTVENMKNEKNVIFNALLANGLIRNSNGDRFIISEKGKELLNYFKTYGFIY